MCLLMPVSFVSIISQKKEWGLKGDTVTYAGWNSIKATLDYDFATEKQFSYEGLSVEYCVKHLAKFASDIWQIHPFCDGNVTQRHQQKAA